MFGLVRLVRLVVMVVMVGLVTRLVVARACLVVLVVLVCLVGLIGMVWCAKQAICKHPKQHAKQNRHSKHAACHHGLVMQACGHDHHMLTHHGLFCCNGLMLQWFDVAVVLMLRWF